jgi:hypothetical protein
MAKRLKSDGTYGMLMMTAQKAVREEGLISDNKRSRSFTVVQLSMRMQEDHLQSDGIFELLPILEKYMNVRF